jgi:hypothetical protein
VSQTAAFIQGLEALKEGQRSPLRRLAGQSLNATVQGFDLFTGLWWPLRAISPATPRREPSWLVAKLFSAFHVPHVRPESAAGPSLPAVLGRCEPPRPACTDAEPLSSAVPDREPGKSQFIAARKHRRRFDALLCSALSSLEPHLCWALGEVSRAVAGHVPHAKDVNGIDWVYLLDDLWLWDGQYNPHHPPQKNRLDAHERLVHCGEAHRTPQDLWACEYLNAANHLLGRRT